MTSIYLLVGVVALLASPLHVAAQQRASNEDGLMAEIPASGTVTLLQMEVAQGIQDIGGSVPIMAGRNTLVRAFLRAASSQSAQIRGTLQVTNDRTGATARYDSKNNVALNALPARISDLRANPSYSLNFFVPASELQDGDVHFEIVEVSTVSGQPIQCPSCHQRRLTVTITQAPPLRLVLVGLRYQDPATGRKYTPRGEDFAALESWLRRAYPATLRVVRRIVDIADRPKFSCETANARLAAIRASDVRRGTDFRTHYYGLVADDLFFMQGCAAGIPEVANPTVVASGPAGRDAFEWDRDGSYADWYGGHELAHALGRAHIGFCDDQAKDDTLYPYDNGQLSSGPATFQGWDPGEPLQVPGALLPGEQWHDVMSYCDYQWVSDYTYTALFQRLAAEAALTGGIAAIGTGEASLGASGRQPPGPAQPAYVSVIGVVNLTRGTGSILEITPTTSTGTIPAPDSGATLLVMDGNGVVLGTHPVWLRETTDVPPGGDRTASVHEVIPYSATIRRVELLLNGRILDAREAGSTAPTVQVVDRSTAGPVPAGTPVTFTWRARDPDNDRLTYTVRVRFAGSTEWETFATGLGVRQITLDREQLMSRRVSELEIVASDGVRVDEVRVVSP